MMKTRLHIGLLLSAFAVMFAFASASFAQRVGGYKVVAVTDAGAVAAADFALDAQFQKTDVEFELGEIVKAERQIVQGSNYRLCMEVTAEGEEPSFVQAVVYVDLKNNRKLSSWVNSTCGGASTTTNEFKGEKNYKAVEIDDVGADLAAQNAVSLQAAKTKAKITFGEMIKVEDKEPKLGARDFRLCMSVVNNGKPGRAQALVSMDQYMNFNLVSWSDTKCGESADGFTTVSNSDAGIGLAADFAVEKHSKVTKIPHKLASIIKAENKGMFAMTYRVCMNVSEEGKTQVIQAVVTMDQYSNMKLVSWEHSACRK